VSWLLDTCVISEMVKPRPAPAVITWINDQAEDELFLSVLTLAELESGIVRLAGGRKKESLIFWVEHRLKPRFNGRLLSFDEETAILWGRLLGTAESQGKKLPLLDSMLAATALRQGLTLVTRNTNDVVKTGVRLFNPWSQKNAAEN
jgi:toxin FitB